MLPTSGQKSMADPQEDLKGSLKGNPLSSYANPLSAFFANPENSKYNDKLVGLAGLASKPLIDSITEDMRAPL